MTGHGPGPGGDRPAGQAQEISPTAGGPDDERDTPMTGMYIGAIVIEAVIIAALWVLGRIYS